VNHERAHLGDGVTDRDVAQLAGELGTYRTRIWRMADPADVAAWVYSDPTSFAPFADLPGAGRAIGNDPEEPTLRYALTLMGALIRSTVPLAGRTAGLHWLLTLGRGPAGQQLRLTVGATFAAECWWAGDDEVRLTLRTAYSPLQAGGLDVAGLERHGIKSTPDTLMFGDDARIFTCPGDEAAIWLLEQPNVVRAARLMNARLCAEGDFPDAARYDPQIVTLAWTTSEAAIAAL
jgi:hypothetical protein